MRPKSLLLLLLALGCGLVASIGISQVMEHRNQAQAPAPETEKIFVASKDIRINEPLNPQNLNLEDWPKEKVPADAVRDLKELENQKAGGTILAGEPIRKGKFANDTRTNEIPKGYRVVAVPADAVKAAGHLLQPGDRVDVIVFVKRDPQAGIDQQVAKTVLQDVRVFAVNEQWRTPEEKTAESISARTVSLLLTPEQVELVTLATEMGDLRLSLRSPDDDNVSETAGKGSRDLLGGGEDGNRENEWATNKTKKGNSGNKGLLSWMNQQKQQPEPEPAPVVAPPPVQDEHFTMVVLKGDQASRVEFTKTGKDGRWKSETAGGESFLGAEEPPVANDPTVPTNPTN